MKRVARMVIISAVVIAGVTAALAVAEAGRYQGVKRIPTVQISQPVSSPATATAAVAAPPIAAPPATTPAPKPKAKAKTSSGSKRAPKASPKRATPAPKTTAKGSDRDHEPTREVVRRKVRDESDEHDGDRTPADSKQSDSND